MQRRARLARRAGQAYRGRMITLGASRFRLTCLALIQLAVVHPASIVAQTDDRVRAALRQALTFYASFDHGFDADYARGDRSIYSAVSFVKPERNVD